LQRLDATTRAVDLGWGLRWIVLGSFWSLAGCGNTVLLQNVNTNDQPLARPKYAAWVAASAKRCGFAREPETIKAAYLAFEAKRGATREEMGRLEEAYNQSWTSIYGEIGTDPVYCTERKVAEIKVALRRQDASDFTPNFSKAESAPPPRRRAADEPFDPQKFWDERAKEPTPAP